MAEETLKRDQNHVTVLGGVTDNASQEVTMLRVDPVTKRLLVSTGGVPGSGTVTSFSFTNANGFTGVVTNGTSTPALTLSYTPPLATCRVYQTSSTVLSTVAWTSIPFGAERFDADGLHNNVTNNTRITFAVTGTYCVGGVVGISENSVLGTRIILNGTTVIDAQVQGNSGVGERAGLSTLYDFTAGDYIELQAISPSMASNTTGDTQTNFWAFQIK